MVKCKVCEYGEEDLQEVNVKWHRHGELCENCAFSAPKIQERKYLERKAKAENFHKAARDGKAIIISHSNKNLGFLDQIKVKNR